MAALTDNRNERDTSNDNLKVAPLAVNVNASTNVFMGAIVYLDAATGRATLVTNAGANKILGIAKNHVNQGASASTDFPLRVETGQLERLTLSGVAQTDLGKIVYATTDNDITLTSAGASRLGILHSIVSGTSVLVRIDPNT